MDRNTRKSLLALGLGFLLVFLFFLVSGSMIEPPALVLKPAESPLKGWWMAQDSLARLHDTAAAHAARIDSLLVKAVPVKDSTAVAKDSAKAKGVANSSSDTSETAVDTGGPRVLLIGDSQLEGLSHPVGEFCVANGYRHVGSVLWYGSTTTQWAESDTLDFFLRKFRPDLVLVAIGLNELFVVDMDNRARSIRTILEKIDRQKIRHFWIGPAAWKQDRGIVKVLSDINGPAFYPSQLLKLERAKDGRHPSRDGAKVWFDSVSRHLPNLHVPGNKPGAKGNAGHLITLFQKKGK